MSRSLRPWARREGTTGPTQRAPGFLGPVVSSLRPYRRRIGVALVVLLAGLSATLAGPALVGYAINNGLVAHHSMRTVDIAGAAYVAVSFAYFVLTRLQTLQVSGIGESYLNDLRKRVFSHLLAQPPQIPSRTLHHRDCQHLRHIIGVNLEKPLAKHRERRSRRFDQEQSLLRCLYRALPPVDAFDPRHDIHARREPAFHQQSRHAAPLLHRRTSAKHHQEARG